MYIRLQKGPKIDSKTLILVSYDRCSILRTIPYGMIASTTRFRPIKTIDEPTKSIDARMPSSRNNVGGGMVVVSGSSNNC